MTLTALVTADICLSGQGALMLKLSADALACGAILLLSPLSYEGSARSLHLVVPMSLSILAAQGLFMFVPGGGTVRGEGMVLSVALMYGFFYTVLRNKEKYATVAKLFRHEAVWHDLESYARMYHLFIQTWLSFFCIVLVASDRGQYEAAAFLTVVVIRSIQLYVRAFSGRTMLVGPKMEKRIQGIMSGDMRSLLPSSPSETPAMNALYKRILIYMEAKKPYLSPDFSLPDLAKAMFTNMSYVSRTINLFSGYNFRQFVNRYRVRYSVALFDNDPGIKVMEAAMMSGFNSMVSFSMSFKMLMKETPISYLGKKRMKNVRSRKELLSSFQEGERSAPGGSSSPDGENSPSSHEG